MKLRIDSYNGNFPTTSLVDFRMLDVPVRYSGVFQGIQDEQVKFDNLVWPSYRGVRWDSKFTSPFTAPTIT